MEEISALADAAWQVLDDMEGGLSCCRASKAQLRLAIEPFISDPADMKDIMTLEKAKSILGLKASL
jgi:hypothetical protein